jgi:hypothetical protein
VNRDPHFVQRDIRPECPRRQTPTRQSEDHFVLSSFIEHQICHERKHVDSVQLGSTSRTAAPPPAPASPICSLNESSLIVGRGTTPTRDYEWSSGTESGKWGLCSFHFASQSCHAKTLEVNTTVSCSGSGAQSLAHEPARRTTQDRHSPVGENQIDCALLQQLVCPCSV